MQPVTNLPLTGMWIIFTRQQTLQLHDSLISIFLFAQLLLLFRLILLGRVDPGIRDTLSLNTAKENEQAAYKTLLNTKDLHTCTRVEQSSAL